MSPRILAVSGYPVKPQTANGRIWQDFGVPTDLESLFVERLKAELEERKLSANALAKAAKARHFKLRQRSVSRILAFEQSPTLEKVHEIAETLGVPAWFLLVQPDQVPQRVISPPVNKTLQTKVLELPRPYPKIFGKKSHPQNGNLKPKKMPTRK